jgi:hypothetical protein
MPNRQLPLIGVLALACSPGDGDASGGGSQGTSGHASSSTTAVDGSETGAATTTPSDSSEGGPSDGSSSDTGTVPGGPGCGLESAAFCDTFDAPSSPRGRAGDLDRTRWSAARGNPQLATSNGNAISAGPATIGECRGDLPTQVFPDDDTLVCDANGDIASPHLLVAVGAQNYGQNSYRIRQPFDFADRTGTIVFDAEGYLLNGLLGWISIEITEDPTPLPSFSIGAEGQNNDEGGAVPRNAIEVQLQTGCLAQLGTVGVRFIDVITDYQDALSMPAEQSCVPGARGKLNHFEIRVSEQHIEVWATPFSADGEHFDPAVLLHETDIALPFSRGWVHLTTHNHATIKYSHDDAFGATEPIDAWVTRWDDVGFDGPIVAGTEFEVADSLVAGTNAQNIMGPVMNVGYRVPDTADGAPIELTLPGVELDGVATARLAVAMWYLLNDAEHPLEQYTLRYRLNRNAWHERMLSAGELAVLTNGHAQGALGQMLELPVEELVQGDNRLELETRGVPQNYPPAASAIDLVLSP